MRFFPFIAGAANGTAQKLKGLPITKCMQQQLLGSFHDFEFCSTSRKGDFQTLNLIWPMQWSLCCQQFKPQQSWHRSHASLAWTISAWFSDSAQALHLLDKTSWAVSSWQHPGLDCAGQMLMCQRVAIGHCYNWIQRTGGHTAFINNDQLANSELELETPSTLAKLRLLNCTSEQRKSRCSSLNRGTCRQTAREN